VSRPATSEEPVRYGFDAQFADDVRRGRKRRTLRRSDKGARPGLAVELYREDGSAQGPTLATGVLLQVDPVFLGHDAFGQPIAVIGGPSDSAARLAGAALDAFAQEDGFADAEQMLAWFRGRYGLPFEGFLHAWTLSPPQGSVSALTTHVTDAIKP